MFTWTMSNSNILHDFVSADIGWGWDWDHNTTPTGGLHWSHTGSGSASRWKASLEILIGGQRTNRGHLRPPQNMFKSLEKSWSFSNIYLFKRKEWINIFHNNISNWLHSWQRGSRKVEVIKGTLVKLIFHKISFFIVSNFILKIFVR